MDQSRLRLRRPQLALAYRKRTPVTDAKEASPVQPDEVPKQGDGRRTALLSAVVALVGVIVGGFITAVASIRVANMTVEAQQKQTEMTVQAQQKQSVAEYRRNNRQKIYQDMLTQMSALESATKSIKLETAILHVGGQQMSDEDRARIITDARNQWQPAYDHLSAAVSNAELVSSQKVIGISKALLIAYSDDFYRMAYGDALSQIKDALEGMEGLFKGTQGLPGTTSPPPSTGFPMPEAQPPPPDTRFPMPGPDRPRPGTQQGKDPLLPGITSSVGVPTELLGKSSSDLKAIFLATAKKDVDLND